MITLEMAKKHLNIEPDFTEDDEYIMHLVDVAEKAVRVHTNDDFDTIAERYDGECPTPLIQAALLMVGNLYMNRELTSLKTDKLPFNYEYLIDLYRNYNN